MIGGLVEAIRANVTTPQGAVADLDHRAWNDRDNSPIDVQLAELDVIGLTSTPINPEIGAGFGGMSAGVMTLRHIATIVLTVDDAAKGDAIVRRDAIVTDLVRRAYHVDWVNTPIADDQSIGAVSLGIEYPELESDTNSAWAVVTFTVDVEWRL